MSHRAPRRRTDGGGWCEAATGAATAPDPRPLFPCPMHELSIVEALIEQVRRELNRVGHKGPVLRLELAVGRLSGVHSQSLRFAFDLLAPGTLVEKAEVEIVEPPAQCVCHCCGRRTETAELLLRCPVCRSEEVTVEGGRDLLLQTIEVADP
jgi:hydrogenase nickel incorporation protein HypA/HybF